MVSIRRHAYWGPKPAGVMEDPWGVGVTMCRQTEGASHIGSRLPASPNWMAAIRRPRPGTVTHGYHTAWGARPQMGRHDTHTEQPFDPGGENEKSSGKALPQSPPPCFPPPGGLAGA